MFLRITTEQIYEADVPQLRSEFAHDLEADGLTDADDDEIVRHLYDQGGPDNFTLVDADVTDVELNVPPPRVRKRKVRRR